MTIADVIYFNSVEKVQQKIMQIFRITVAKEKYDGSLLAEQLFSSVQLVATANY